MPQLIISGAMLQCAFGSTPAQLVVLPVNRVNSGNQPVATIMDHVPLTNVMPFGMCSSPNNPQVVAAKGPVPCMPGTTSPWTPGSLTVQIGNQPAISSVCQLNCQWGGVISVLQASQQTVNVP